MPFILGLLKNPAVLKWGAIALICAALFTYGKIQYIRAENLQSDLAVAEQSIESLRVANEAKRVELVNVRNDLNNRTDIFNSLNETHIQLVNEYGKTKTKLSHILNTVIPAIKTPEQVAEAKIIVQTTLSNSYGCIMQATGNRGATCEQ